MRRLSARFEVTDFKKYRVDDKVECVVCLTENATVKCDSGNHLYACSDCYEKLRLTTDDRCPVCRAPNTIPLIVDTQTYSNSGCKRILDP